jgi:hypothetical protein
LALLGFIGLLCGALALAGFVGEKIAEKIFKGVHRG